MKISEFISDFRSKKIQNTTIAPNAVSEYIRTTLEVKTYLPFREKRVIAEVVVKGNVDWVNGIKKYDNVNSYISFIVATFTAYTNLEFDKADPIADYDLLAESGLLPLIIDEFKVEYDEVDVLVKMLISSELEDNNINVLVGNFLNGILEKMDGAGEVIKTVLEKINVNDILGKNIKEEDLAKLSDLLNTLK